jgi:DNA-binding beta-propeller fold protein YncE
MRNVRVQLILMVVVAASCSRAWAKEPPPAPYKVARQIPLPGAVAYHDFLNFDEGSGKLFVSHGDQVVVVDPESGKVLAAVPGFQKVHGIAVAGGRAFATDGTPNLVRVFDLQTSKLVGEVATGKAPDAITYDPASRRIVAFNHGEGSATFIDPASAKATATVPLGGGGKAEVGQADGKGTIWVNVEDKNEIVRLDSKKQVVTAHWPIAPCETPTGLGFDGKHRRLFAGCEGNRMMVVVDADSGKVITHLPIGDRVDGADYDPGTGDIFASCADGTLTVIHQQDADHYTVVQTLQTLKTAKTLTLDRKRHRVFLSAKVTPPATPGQAAAPATLVVLVVER